MLISLLNINSAFLRSNCGCESCCAGQLQNTGRTTWNKWWHHHCEWEQRCASAVEFLLSIHFNCFCFLNVGSTKKAETPSQSHCLPRWMSSQSAGNRAQYTPLGTSCTSHCGTLKWHLHSESQDLYSLKTDNSLVMGLSFRIQGWRTKKMWCHLRTHNLI